MQNTDRLNALLLDLYQLVPSLDPDRFQAGALALLSRTIGFDRAWWGILTQDGGAPTLRSSYRYELPESFEAQWEEIKHQDHLARDVRLQPRVTVNFDERSLRSTPGLAALNETHELRHALCTSMFLPDRRSFLFVSLFRSFRSRGFSAAEMRLKQALTPHLYGSWRSNLLYALAPRCAAAPQTARAAAFVDRTGQVICAEPSFPAMVVEAWPSWTGDHLPAGLLTGAAVERPRRCAPGNDPPFRSQRRDAGGLTRIELRRSSPLDRLTPRERQIARLYADARSHKEVARGIGRSPATVRHHLRVIFEKLEIREKAALVRLVDRFDEGAARLDHIGGGYDRADAGAIDRLGCASG